MKGGKSGRKRRTSTAAPARAATPRGKGGKVNAAKGKRPPNVPPPKGSRKKPDYGWSSSTEET